MKKYRFLPEAETESRESARYFDEQSPGLGSRFIAEIESTIRFIREFPESGARVTPKIRKRVARGFKYNVLYIELDDAILIVAVAPHRRRPGYWRKRLRR